MLATPQKKRKAKNKSFDFCFLNKFRNIFDNFSKRLGFYLRNKAQHQVTLFSKSQYPLSFKPFLTIQGLAVLLFFVVLASLCVPQPQLNQQLVVKTTVTKQNSTIFAGGNPVAWTTLVKRSDITSGQYLLKLPKGATNIKVVTIDATQANDILKLTPKEQLSLYRRQQLALQSQNNSKFLARVSQFLFADLEQAASDVVKTVAEQIVESLSDSNQVTETQEATIVDLSEQIVEQPAPSVELEQTKQEEKQDKKQQKGADKEIEKDSKEDVPAQDQPAPDQTEEPTSEGTTSSTEEEVPASETPITDLLAEDVTETISPSDADVADIDILDTTILGDQPVVEPEIPEKDEYVKIDYETPAPEITEQETDTGKMVTVSSVTEDPNVLLTDVLASTKIPEFFKVGDEHKIKIKWLTSPSTSSGQETNMPFLAYDTDNNGKLDYVEWTVPHLSEQIFEIIFISKAFQLDQDQQIIADIYDQTVTKNDVWAQITNGQYVRATFEKILDNTKDNTIYAKPTNPDQPATIEVYPVYTDDQGNVTEGLLLATFPSIYQEDTYKVLLTDLETPTDTFDLKVTGGVDIDWIFDPTGYVDPNGDAANDGWHASYNLYDALNETAGTQDGTNINGDPIGRGTAETATLDLDMATFTVSGTVSGITVYFYMNAMTQATIYANIYVDGAWQTEQQVWAATVLETPGFKSVTFSAGGWDQTDLDNLRVRVKDTATAGNQGGTYLDAVYAAITDGAGTTNVLPNGDLVNSKWRWSANTGPTTSLYTMLDDGLRSGGAAPDYWDTIGVTTAVGPTTYTYDINMTSITSFASASEMKVWAYITAPNKNSDLSVNIYVNEAWQTPVEIVDNLELDVEEWRSATFDVSLLGLDQTDVDGLKVRLATAQTDGWINVPAVYVEITYSVTPAAFDQKHFRIYDDDAGINSATALAAEDTNYNITVGNNFRIRFEMANTGGTTGNITRRLEFNEDSAGWTQITTGTNNVRLVNSTNFTDADATTSRLTATGTFTAGQGKDTGSDATQLSLTGVYYTEDEYSLKFETAAAGKTYQFRITNTGVALGTYTVTPSIVPVAADSTPPVPTVTGVGGDSASAWSTSDTTPTITLTLDETGDCYASETDEAYDDMSTDVNCTGDGTTSITCQITSALAESASKTIYVACQDTPGNKDTIATNEAITMEVDATPPTETVTSIAEDSSDPYTGVDSTPTLIFTTNETGDCFASTDGDETYDEMSDDTDCTVGTSTSHTCTLGDLGADGAKTIYLACKDDTDASANKDTALTNTVVTYTLASGGGPPGGNTHNECNLQRQCVSVSGSGVNQCSTYNDCAVHNVCNLQKQCVQVTGQPAPDGCQTNADCNLTHTECDGSIIFCRYDGCTGMQCVLVNGQGNDQCSSDNDCTAGIHNECNSQKQCVLADGVGSDLCVTNSDCNATYSVCENNSCIQKSGVGVSQCQTNADCQVSSGFHNECNASNQCVQISGSGSNLCQTNSDCSVSHADCQTGQCVQVSGVGVSQCQTNADCLIAKHNECNSQKQCVLADGEGFDLCQNNNECNLVYTECESAQCVEKIGIGTNQCQTNFDCFIAKHNECNSQKQCVPVNGAGQDGCQTDSSCGSIFYFHRECNSQKQCVSVSGSGSDQCGTAGDCESGGYVSPAHNECNSKKQCVSVDGEGSDQCTADNDCKGSAPIEIIETIIETIKQQIPEQIVVATEEVKKIVESPEGSVITKAVSTTGFIVATIAVGSAFSFSFLEIFLIPLRLLGLLLTAVGLKKRVLPWGVVYDSVTKQPLDPAYVTLRDINEKNISSAITDLDGRYGFLVGPGTYQIIAQKTNYNFPSQKFAGRKNDELHADLYFGGNIYVKKSGEVIVRNIPLDPIKFDWNEFAKKNKNLMKFYSKWDVVLRKIYDFFFVIGFIVAVVAYAFAPYPYNTVIIVLYLFLLLLRVLGLKPRTYGYIAEKATGVPLSFAIVRVMMPGDPSGVDRVVASKSADKYGKYYCLVPPGKYYVKIEKKNNNGSYSLAYTSSIIDVSKKGIIKERFKV